MKKITILLAIIMCLISFNIYANSSAKDITKLKVLDTTKIVKTTKRNTIILFYSSTCGSCREIDPIIKDIKKKYSIKIIKYNTLLPKYSKLMADYEKKYKVKKKDTDIIPKIFYKDISLTGSENICENLEREVVSRKYNIDTPLLKSKDPIDYKLANQFINYKLLGIIGAGLLNGISPCSISTILLFLSIIISNKNILKLGIAFCTGKFISFLLMGTILYKFLSLFDFSIFNNIFKIFMLLFLYILAVLNLNDFFAAKNEKYDKIKLQLPSKLRKLNSKALNILKNSKYLIVLSFLLSIIISTGEFLCTGQIYLSTIVTIYHTNPNLNILSLTYLLIYNIALIIPLLTITIVVYRTNSIFVLSDFARKNLHIIKLLNIIIYIMIAVIIITTQ